MDAHPRYLLSLHYRTFDSCALITTWLNALDDRNVPALGRIGDPDDIIASVRVEDGQVRRASATIKPRKENLTCLPDSS